MKNENFREIIDLADEMIQHRDGEKFFHKKVFSDDKIYIYQVNGKWFEVFNKKIKPKREKVGDKIVNVEGVGRVAYPNDNDFGFWAWHIHDKNGVSGILRNRGYSQEEIDAVLGSFIDNPYANREGGDKYKGTEKLSSRVKQGWMLYND